MTKRRKLTARATARTPLLALAALALLCVLARPRAAVAQQWTSDASGNINSTNTGNVGIGATGFDPWAPAFKVLGLSTNSGFTVAAGNTTGYGLHLTDRAYYDGTVWRYSATGSAASNLFMASGIFGVRVAGAGTAGSNLTWTDALRVSNSGNVGVGTGSPGYRLHVAGDNTASGGYPVVKLQNTQAGGHSFWLYAGATGSPGAFGLYDETAGLYRLFVDQAGNVGVGTTSPVGSLNVPTGAVVIGQNYGAGAVLRVGRLDALYPAIVSASNYNDATNPVFLARSYGPGTAPTGNGVFNFLGTNSDTTRTFSADYAGNGYFAGSVGIGTTTPGASYQLDVQGGKINAGGGLCIAGDCKNAWPQPSASQWTTAGTNVYYGAGSVGVGTASPAAKLDVAGPVTGSGVAIRAGGGGDVMLASGGTLFFDDNYSYASGSYIRPVAPNTQSFVTAGTERVRIDAAGHVGIGKPNPAVALDVTGDINASGTITGGNIQAKYQDVAEWVPASKLLPAGTVVVLDASRSNQVTSSSKAYDTRVAGVVSPQPGIALGERGEGKALVATTGRVRVKVDATKAPIAVGDLLVTSDVEGVAMKSVPVDLGGVQIHRPGTIIGKALEPLEKGTGEILVLLSLQ